MSDATSGDDRARLRALVEAYARCADGGDCAGFAELFLPDARLTTWPVDGSPGMPHHGVESISHIPATLCHRYDRTEHIVGETNVVIAGEGRTALGTTECEAHHIRGSVDRVLTIRYDDRFAVGADGSWRFASRDVRVLAADDRPLPEA